MGIKQAHLLAIAVWSAGAMMHAFSIPTGAAVGSLAVQDDGKKYKITFFGNNLTNKSYTTAIADGNGFFGGAHVMTQVLPANSQRYYGVRLKYDF